MKRIVLAAAFVLGTSSLALADEAGACQAAAGSYVTGTVLTAPRFVGGQPRKGVELSHTRLSLKADQDGRTYDVAIDNVFAAGYDAARHSVPAPLNTIVKGDRLELCGQLYTSGVGIHWVHTNCGVTPSPDQPNGWVKKLAADGSPGDNLEGATEYCKLWP
jgi:hypothetical protein